MHCVMLQALPAVGAGHGTQHKRGRACEAQSVLLRAALEQGNGVGRGEGVARSSGVDHLQLPLFGFRSLPKLRLQFVIRQCKLGHQPDHSHAIK